MPGTEREVIEREINRVLVEQWDPLGVHTQPGEHDEYRRYVPSVYSLLARGASDVQVARFLHQIERDELGHPELAQRDLTPVLQTLRALEREI